MKRAAKGEVMAEARDSLVPPVSGAIVPSPFVGATGSSAALVVSLGAAVVSPPAGGGDGAAVVVS